MAQIDKFFDTYLSSGIKVIQKQPDTTVEVKSIPPVEGQPLQVTRPTINIRLTPDKNGDKVGQVHKGDIVYAVEVSEDWVKLIDGGYLPTSSVKEVEV